MNHSIQQTPTYLQRDGYLPVEICALTSLDPSTAAQPALRSNPRNISRIFPRYTEIPTQQRSARGTSSAVATGLGAARQ